MNSVRRRGERTPLCDFCGEPLNDREAFCEDADLHERCADQIAAAKRDDYDAEAYDRARERRALDFAFESAR